MDEKKQVIVEVGPLQTGIQARILQVGVPNQNKRVYPAETAQAILQQIEMRCENGTVLGELGSDSPREIHSTINLDRVSHEVRNPRMKDGYLVVDVKLLETPNGKILNKLHATGMNLRNNFRTRGLGCYSQGPDGTILVTNYQLISVDFVSNPA